MGQELAVLLSAAPKPTKAFLEDSVLKVLSAYTNQTAAALSGHKTATLSSLLQNPTAYGFLTKRLRGLLQYFNPDATILRAEVQAKKLTIQDLIDVLWQRVQ